MELWLTLAIGVLFATGTYLVLRRSLLKVVIGFALISHGTNLLLLTTGKLKRGAAPILVEGYQGPYVDPLPQALILTAIVISFAVTAFMLALVYRTYQSLGTDDLDRLRRPPG
jgi:multicomponent Na+:H+ antiporter subunit C